MQRLIDDANEYAKSIGMASDLSIESFADIVQAIELVQEKQHVAGTTAKEAASTLQGSLGMTKSAWQNLITGLANPDADLGKLVQNFADSAKITAKNFLPIIKTGLQGVGSMVTELLPDIFDMLPDLLDDVLPSLLDTINVTISKTFPAIAKIIAKNMPLLVKTIAQSGKTIVTSLYDAIAKELSGNFIFDTIVSGAEQLIPIFSEIGNNMLDDAKTLFKSIGELVQSINFSKIFNSLEGAFNNLSPILEKAGDRLVWLWDNALSPLIEWGANDLLPAAIDAVSEAFRALSEVGEMLEPIATAVWEEFLKPLASWTGDAVVAALGAITDGLKAFADEFEGVDWGGYWEDIDEFGENWKSGLDELQQGLLDNEQAIDEFFDVSEVGVNWREFWEGVGDAVFTVKDKSEQVGEAIFDLKEKWNNFFEEFGEWDAGNMLQALDDWKDRWTMWSDSVVETWEAIQGGIKTAKDTLQPLGDVVVATGSLIGNFFKTSAEKVSLFVDNWSIGYSSIKDIASGAVTDIKDAWETGANAIWNKWDTFKEDWKTGNTDFEVGIDAIKDKFDEIGTKLSGLASDALKWGKDLVTGFADGIKSGFSELEGALEDFGEKVYDYVHFSEPDKGALSNFHTFAPDMMELFAKGITDNSDKPEKAIDDMLNNVKNSFADVTPAYTSYNALQGGTAANAGAGGTVTLQLVDGAYNVIARGTANVLNVLQGQQLQTEMRGRQV